MAFSVPTRNFELFIGRPVWELPTPALCVDTGILDANLSTLNEMAKRAGVDWRADVSCHMCPELAKQCVAAGSTGISVATVDQAGHFLAAGLTDIVIRQPVVGRDKLDVLATLLPHGKLTVSCDHYAQAQPLSELLVSRGLSCDVRVEVNLGRHQTGVRAGWDALDLVKGISSLPGVRLSGIWGDVEPIRNAAGAAPPATMPEIELPEHEFDPEASVAHPFSPTEKEWFSSSKDWYRQANLLISGVSLLNELRQRMRQDGWDGSVSAAGAATELHGGFSTRKRSDTEDSSHTQPPGRFPLTEILIGREVLGFGVPQFGAKKSQLRVRQHPFPAASHVVASVISRPKLERAVIDVGSRQLGDSHRDCAVSRTARGRSIGLCQVNGIGADHTTLMLPGQESFELLIGEKVEVRYEDPGEVWPKHVHAFVLREGVVTDIWKIV